jgi:hypothetical protein
MADRDFVLLQQQNRPYIRDRRPVMAYPDLPPKMKKERGILAEQAKILRHEGKATRIRTAGLEVIMEFKEKGQRGGWKKFVP